MGNKWVLIENNSQSVIEFSSLKELKAYAKQNGYRIHRSPTKENCYYTESYVYLPIFDE
jgi:hypothetical protein